MPFRETPRLYPASTPKHERIQPTKKGAPPTATTPNPRPTTTPQARGARSKQSTKGNQDDHKTVMEQKVKNRLEKEEQEKEGLKTKIGVTAHPYYTVPKDWKEILKGEGPNGEKYR